MQHTSVKIPSGQSQSGIVELWNDAIVAIHFPTGWTATSVTLLAAVTAKGPFLPVYDASGVELTITAAADRVVAVDRAATRGLAHVKLRAGTAAAPVNVSADRTLRLMLRDDT